MKKIITASLVLVSFGLSAQVRDLMLNKAGNVLNKNKQTNTTTTTDTTSKTQNTTTTTNQQPQTTGMFGMVSKSELKSEYKFNHDALVEVQSYKKSGETEGDLVKHRMFFAEEGYYGGEYINEKSKKPSKTVSIIEFERNIMIMLMDEDSKKTGFAMKQDYSKNTSNTSDSTSYKVVKTGRTKTILGYLCEEWLVTNTKNKDKSEVWITSKVTLDILKTYKMMSSSSRGNSGKKYDVENYPKGFMMESTHYSENGEKTTWKVVELNLNNTTIFKTGDYEFSGQ